MPATLLFSGFSTTGANQNCFILGNTEHSPGNSLIPPEIPCDWIAQLHGLKTEIAPDCEERQPKRSLSTDMNSTTINAAEPTPVQAPASLPYSTLRPSGSTVVLPIPGHPTTPNQSQTAGLEGENSDVANAETRMPERKRRQEQKRYTSALDRQGNWLLDDPSQWQGRRVLRRKTGTIYFVKQAFKSGRVELEKSWMVYLTDVKTVRAEYEPYG